VQFQKLTRNLFLTLHGHNVHRQQRQLSKFLVCYQQFAFRAYYGAAVPVSKMASQQEKAFRVLGFEVSRSVITVQCAVSMKSELLVEQKKLGQLPLLKVNVVPVQVEKQISC
jgi:hypothetical protein